MSICIHKFYFVIFISNITIIHVSVCVCVCMYMYICEREKLITYASLCDIVS